MCIIFICNRNILHEIRKRKANWIGHILRRNCLLQQVIEGKMKRQIEVTRRRGRRRKKLLDDLKDRRGYCQLKEEAQDSTMWKNRFGRGFGPVVWQITIGDDDMPCSTLSFLAINTRTSAYFTVWIILSPTLKSPSPTRTSFVRHSLYKLNRIGDKQHPCLTPLPVWTLLVSPRYSCSLTFCSIYNLLINIFLANRYQFSLRSALI